MKEFINAGKSAAWAAAALMSLQLSAQNQFDDFESNTDFTSSQQGNKSPQQQQQQQTSPTPSGESGAQGKDFFGRQQQRQQNSDYVNLNFDTGYGEGVVTSFDFPDADIMEVTKFMQDLTGINLILDKDVKGKVSITAPQAITIGDAWKAYVTALNMAGYTIVPSGDKFYKIINARDIRYTPTEIYTGTFAPDIDNYVMKVMSLQHVDVNEIARNFRPFLSRYGRIIDIKQTNTIIIADTGTTINRLMRLIKFIDVPGFEESLHIIPVNHSSAQEIAKLLQEITMDDSSSSRRGRRSSRGSNAASPDGSAQNISKIIAEPRTNSIIALANSAGAKELRGLINKLDVKLVARGSGKLHVYYLKNRDAESLANSLGGLISGVQTVNQGAGGGSGGGPGGGSSRASSSRGRSGRGSSFSTGNGNSAEDAIFTDDVQIVADISNNALVVTASPTDWLTLEHVIKQLDVPRDQVFVEGLILETNLNKLRDFGVSYYGAYGAGDVERAGFGSQDDAGNFLSLIQSGFVSLGGLFAGVGIGAEKEITVNTEGGPVQRNLNAINAFVKAVASNSSSNIIATPQILALDNTEAVFASGQTIPTQQIQNNVAGAVATGFAQQEVKLELKITPQINKITRFVKLTIEQQIENVLPNSQPGQAGGLPTSFRTANTEVLVRDKDTIVMSGLIRDEETVEQSKIPLLGDIPVLGWLFKSRRKQMRKENLLFFLTPKILATYEETAAANTKTAIEGRNESIREVSDEKDDPFREKLSNLMKKLDKQEEGPLFDEAKLLDSENVNKTLKFAPEGSELPIPNYQEIAREAIQEQQNGGGSESPPEYEPGYELEQMEQGFEASSASGKLEPAVSAPTAETMDKALQEGPDVSARELENE